MSYHPQHVRLVIVKMMRDRKGWQGCGERKTPAHCGWCCKWAQPLLKTAQSFLTKYFNRNYHTTNSATRFLVFIRLTFPLFQQHVQCLCFEPILSKTCLFLFQFQMMRVQKQATPSLQPSWAAVGRWHQGGRSRRSRKHTVWQEARQRALHWENWVVHETGLQFPPSKGSTQVTSSPATGLSFSVSPPRP